jgi:phosphoserine aminotransferase
MPLGLTKGKSMARIYNFSPGPAMLPAPVLERAREELRGWRSTGVSVMEISHRGKDFIGIAEKAEADLRELLAIPDNYKVLFLAGGATAQFTAAPMNLWRGKTRAAYVGTGYWSEKAIAEAWLFGQVQVAASAKDSHFTTIPHRSLWNVDPDAAYLHYTANETIGGVEFHAAPETDGLPLVADMSSNILSRPVDVNRFGLIYANAQKNIGLAGMAVVIVREDLIGQALPWIPSTFDCRQRADKGSMVNTPPTYAWYIAGLMLEWLKEQGGLVAVEARNIRKATKLYAARRLAILFEPRGTDRSLAQEPAISSPRHAAETVPGRRKVGWSGISRGAPLRGWIASQHLQRHA